MKKWNYINECRIIKPDNIALTITAENVQDGWEMPIAEIQMKIKNIENIIVSFYGILSIQDIYNHIFMDFLKKIKGFYIDNYDLYDENTNEIISISKYKFLQLLNGQGIKNVSII